MKHWILFFFTLVIACKAKQITDTSTSQFPKLDFHHGSEFDLFPMGKPLIMGDLMVTPLRPGLAAISSETTEITSKTVGSPSSFVHKDKSVININSGNVDRSKDKSKLNSDNTDKSKDKSRGDLDKSRVKVKVPAPSFLKWIWVFVLLIIGLIWFFAPRIKNFLKPPGL